MAIEDQRDRIDQWRRMFEADPVNGCRRLLEASDGSLALASWRLAVVRLILCPEFVRPVPTRIDIAAAAAAICAKTGADLRCPSLVLEELESLGLEFMP